LENPKALIVVKNFPKTVITAIKLFLGIFKELSKEISKTLSIGFIEI